MSQLGRIVTEILHRYFGEIVQRVGSDLFKYGSKSISTIMKTTGLSRKLVIKSLWTLLKLDLATFEATSNEAFANYKLVSENVLLFIRYPRYLFQMKSKYGSEAEILVEELLQQSTCTAGRILVSIATRYKDDKEKKISIVSLKDTFVSLATAGYIQQAPVAEFKEGSDMPTLVPVATIVPAYDSRALVQALSSGDLSNVDDGVYWRVNFDRFHQDFRDEIMIKAISQRIDDNAGELMRYLLQLMYLTSPAWTAESNPIPALELRARCRRNVDRPLLNQYVDEYLKVIEENGAGFVRRIGDNSGGQYVVRAKHAAQQLVENIVEHTVTERLGSKAARIFRVIRSKKYIEEEDIQKQAMLPNKECKELTYKLVEQHFVSVQPMRKAASAGGMAKTIYLYHVKFYEVSQTAQEMCYRALHNVLKRYAHERDAHARLLDKRRRVATLVHGMRERGESDQNIADVEEIITPPEHVLLKSVENKLKLLSVAELELDRTLFILKWYLTS